MATNSFKLESGQEYSLKHLFSGKNRIVIPDLQRDYCWGDKAWNKDANNYTELVSGFVENLLSAFKNNSNDKLTLGLIYGYENPHFTIQLCDGQQRLTTLFLLVGMINRRTTNNNFEEILISKEELEDDREPNLLYAIRESTLYFLSDLVCEFFLDNKLELAELTNKDWYFKEYDLDASIQSMLCAIKTIETKLVDIDCNAFGDFIINNLQMLYYDMGHRTRGEETFVVINTTGEPLTATENLKPILIGNIGDEQKRRAASTEWEDREEWFWQNRDNKEQTSDSALNDFFVWYWQIRLLQEKSWRDKKSYPLNPNELFQKKPVIAEDQEENPYTDNWDESKNLDTVHKYFNALKLLLEKSKDDSVGEILKTINNEEISLSWFRSSKVGLDIILPLIAYVEKFKDKNLYQFVRRIRKNFFDKQYEVRKNNFIDWRYILQIINYCDTPEAVLEFGTRVNEGKFRLIPNVSLNEWYNQDEQNKKSLKIDHRDEVEDWEDHKELNGDLNLLWVVNGDNIIDYNTVNQYYQSFKILSDCLVEEKSKDDPILSNYFRLYKVLIGYPEIGHIDYCTWDMEGALFSWRDPKSNNFIKYHSDERLISLIRSSPANLKEELKNRLKSIFEETSIIDINKDNFSVSKHLKAWLFIKVLYANSKNELLSFDDKNVIAAYKDYKKNMLNENIELSLANTICGYAIKSPANRIDYTNEENWGKIHCINTIIGNSISYSDFNNRENKPISEDQIAIITQEINNLVNSFLN